MGGSGLALGVSSSSVGTMGDDSGPEEKSRS